MTPNPMRKLPSPSTSSLRRKNSLFHPLRVSSLQTFVPARYLAQVRPEPLSELWFSSTSPSQGPADDLLGFSGDGSDHKPPDERTLNLGKTLRTISPLLPTMLTTALPPEILSPAISLHLFPSTHPHLPAVKGKVAYRAALWTAPVAWGCVPFVGNTKLRIISEKIVRTGFATQPHNAHHDDLGDEKLVVRWQTEKSEEGASGADATTARPFSHSPTTADGHGGGINRGLSALLGGDKPASNFNGNNSFTGLFIFCFDTEGRVAQHTIEHADEDNGFDKTSRVVTLADWLLGKAKWGTRKGDEFVPELAIKVCRTEWRGHLLAGQAGGKGRMTMHLLEPETVQDRMKYWRERW